MKFNSVLAVSSLLVLATAQSTTTTSTATATATLSPEASCAAKCNADDVCCRAGCYKVPCPSDQQANDTVSCVAACPQGSGSPSDTDKYAACQSSCYSSHFFPATATLGGSSATGSGSKDATATNSDSAGSSKETGSSGSDSSKTSGSSSSGTRSGSSASSTANAAPISQLQLGVSAAGLFGFVLAAWAL
ncbi:uncharacterized protein ACLA_031530 [Aspergillus clavatus NRRL 1]|uniref:GPI anchored serine-threonine rich protein n=1 Tax=Aspergillus clavatus (strain ATCC 1007 / CBS 513.65 / DSM 816 / NCTC 3887 / NRRL 1 / QM 1276 / 107) TaxID=344612 RepID=A1CRZ9_ASPCL|nr:uncharacterized protein ACLA_031530 [Aspergillus clavatus NRRL 1]EAW08420.1 conserved hypothetical protein [Aspergillus clavatus NRRL 1]